MFMERRKKSNKFLHVCAYQTVVFLLFSLISSYKAIELVAAADHSSFLPLSISEIIVLFWEECAWTHDLRVSHDHHRTAWRGWRQGNSIFPENNGRDENAKGRSGSISSGLERDDVDESIVVRQGLDLMRAGQDHKKQSMITELLWARLGSSHNRSRALRTKSFLTTNNFSKVFGNSSGLIDEPRAKLNLSQSAPLCSFHIAACMYLLQPVSVVHHLGVYARQRGMKTNRSEIMIATSHGILRGRCVMDWFVSAIKTTSIKWPLPADRPAGQFISRGLTRIFNCHPTLQD